MKKNCNIRLTHMKIPNNQSKITNNQSQYAVQENCDR